MTNVKSYTDGELLARMARLESFRGFPHGPFDIWVRSNEDAYDRFDDKVYTFHGSGGDASVIGTSRQPKFVMVCSGTSNPGAGALQGFGKYNRLGADAIHTVDMPVLPARVSDRLYNLR